MKAKTVLSISLIGISLLLIIGSGKITLASMWRRTELDCDPYPVILPVHRPDVDWDGDVDVTDVTMVAATWRAGRGDSEYRQYYDLHHDGQIDIVDIMRVVVHWDETFCVGPHFLLSYGPYRPGQDPNDPQNPMPSPAEIEEDMTIVQQETKVIRTYGACDELGLVPSIADQYGIHVYQGVALGSTSSNNDREMACFQILIAENDNIVAGVIGNEVLLFGRLSESQLINYLSESRELGNVSVTTGEPWGVWCNETEAKPRCQGRPALGEAVDFILAHIYPYWEAMPIEHGPAFVVSIYATLRATYPNRVVVVGETGWPTDGDPFGNALPSLENQRQFVEELWQWANLYHIPVLYFEAFDEDWKAASEGEVGRHWGVYYSNRTPKHLELNWSIPTMEPPPPTPIVRIEHPRDITSTRTRSNCTVPIFGTAYNAQPGWQVKVEVFTNQWYVQDKWYPDGLVPIINGLWGMPEIYLAGQGVYNDHKIRATLVDIAGNPVTSDQVTGIVRTNDCSP